MAHELEIVNGKAKMAYRQSVGVPWHGLGVPVGDDLSSDEMMKAAGLDWTVSKVDTYAKVNEKFIPTGRKALIRDTDSTILTEVGAGWNPVQNQEAFDFFDDFVKKGDMLMDTAGSLKGGRIVWALADLKDGFEVFGGDEMKGYLLFSNPHIYGQTVNVKFCLTRTVCQNTLTMALAERGIGSISLNHRASFSAEKVKHALGISHRKMETFKETTEFLGSKQFTKPDLYQYFGDLFGTSSEDKTLTRTAEKVMDMVETQPGSEYRPGSWWQAYNAVTYAVDHELGRSSDTRMTSAWFGQGAKKKIEALNLGIKMAEASA